MQSNRNYSQDLATIRAAMERSVKFLSLSGLSGVMAGIYALSGTALAFFVLRNPQAYPNPTLAIIVVAVAVLMLSLTTGFILSLKKARRLGLSIWNQTSREFLSSLFIPLAAGGLFIIILLLGGYARLVASSCLLFYGMALLNASFFTVREIKYLGISEIILGLLAALLPEQGLWLWGAGFGLLHIIYGAMVFFRYDREKSV
ncbi:MAG: hypothetical protein KatS3mg032_1157 [Cyclobacteriaceae bacterium]|nr:MAG: hypothetical protein KatS3mg032_1157 [Cyclobacteriaceae bacterium]